MKRWLSTISVVLGGLGLLGGACAGQNGAPPSGGEPGSVGDEGGGVGPVGVDAGDASDDSATAPPQAYLRVAHLSPDMPPIDVCVAPHGTGAFQGPLVGQLASTFDDGGADGAAPGLAYAQVSAYLPLTPGQYDVRIVPAGATSCVDASLDATADAGGVADAALDAPAPAPTVPDGTNLPPLAFNTHATLLVAGEASPAGSEQGISLGILSDDGVLAGGAAVLRAVNAIPSAPALDFGLGSSATTWVPILTDVAFGAASAQVGPGGGAVDANGYLAVAPMSGQAMSARSSGADAAADLAAASNVEIDLGSISTVVAIGGKTGDVAHPPALLLCNDNQPSGGLLSDCSVAQ